MLLGPLTDPKTYAAGAASEGYAEQSLNMQSPANTRGLLTSNGSVSPFLVALMKELNYERVPSGGAGNKMLMLLEGRGSAYIQDRYEFHQLFCILSWYHFHSLCFFTPYTVESVDGILAELRRF